jgi:hypothetical protein
MVLRPIIVPGEIRELYPIHTSFSIFVVNFSLLAPLTGQWDATKEFVPRVTKSPILIVFAV